MIAVDTNVLVYAHRKETIEHDSAFEILRALAEGSDPWAIPWPCAYEFFSVVTNARIWKSAASSPEQAWKQLEVWLAAPSVRLLSEPQGFADVLSGFLTRPRVRGGIVHDARIAAICVAHAIDKLLSRDRDFSLFPELVTENPFA